MISTNVGEMRLAIKNNPIGTIIYDNSVEELANAILEYFHNPRLTQKYSQNARSYIDTHYSKQAFEQAGESILNRIKTQILSRFKK